MMLELFKWLSHTSLGLAMRDSTWAFATVEMAHLLGLALLGGSILLVDLRLIGVVLRRYNAAQLSRDVQPVLAGSLVFTLVSGMLLLASDPIKYYYNTAFRWKIALVAVVVIFHLTAHAWAVQDRYAARPAVRQAAGVLSISLWTAIGLAGRAIGFI